MTWALVALIGLVAGVVSGLFGVGGAIVIIPGLVLVAKLPQHTANGTSLAALLLPVGLLGAWEYYRRGQVNVPYAAIIAVGLFFGALLGAKLAGTVSDVALRRGVGGVLMIVARPLLVRQGFASKTLPSPNQRDNSLSSWAARNSPPLMSRAPPGG